MLSARNQFKGKIVSLTRGAVMSEVIIDIGDIGGGHQIVSLISTSSVKGLADYGRGVLDDQPLFFRIADPAQPR